MYQPVGFGPEYHVEDMILAHIGALGFMDISDSNKGCPFFYREKESRPGIDIQIIVWIDARYKEDRHLPNADRFMLEVCEKSKRNEACMTPVYFQGSDFWIFLARIREALVTYKFPLFDVDENFILAKKDLAEVGVILLGHDPFENDPAITQMSVARLLMEYLNEAINHTIEKGVKP